MAITLVAATLVAPGLRAETPRIVEFVAPESGCPEAGFVDQRFRSLVGDDEVETSSRAVVSVEKAGEQYELLIRIRTGDETAERRFRATSCRLGAETAALIIAISLFPDRANDLEQRAQSFREEAASSASSPARTADAAAPEPAAPPAAAEPEPSSAPPPFVRARPSERGPTPDLELALSLGVGLDTTTMPAPGAGLGAAVALGVDRFSLELTGAGFFAQTLELPNQRSARFVLVTLGVHVCYAVVRERVSVSVRPCVGAFVQRLSGEGFGADRNFERVSYHAGPALGAAIAWHATDSFGVRIYAESFVPVVRPRFELDSQFVHRPGAVGVSAFIGPELTF